MSTQDVTHTDGAAREGALGPYLRALRARKLMTVAITLVAIAAAGFMLSRRHPSYVATTQMLVTPLAQNDQTFIGINLVRDSGDPTRTIQTAAALIGSVGAAQLTAARVGQGLTAEQVESDVTIIPVGQSNLVAITATAGTGRLAAQLATSYAEQSLYLRNAAIRRQIGALIATLRNSASPGNQARILELRAVLENGDPTLSISQPATVPSSPSGASKWLVLVLAAVVGFVLASVAAVLAEQFNRRVRGLEDLVALYPLPILTRVPAVRRSDEIEDPFKAPAAVREAFHTLQIQLDQRRVEGRTVIIASATGKDGKTAVALNLALALVGSGHRVLLLDFDLRKPDLERRLGLAPSRGLTSLLTDSATLSELVQPVPRLAPLSVVAAAGAPGDMALLPVLAQRLAGILDEAGESFDYVVIDTAPLGEVGDTLAIVGAADDLILVGRPGNTDRAGLGLVRELLTRAGTQPSGWIVVGEDDLSRGAYYDYGPDAAASDIPRRRRSSK
ncbi:MAG TPA: AAA family ATPase [Solirubrobacteraceae bacterium]|nr:AAA family ATPase [Solirubrobacteraceae bacterium]